MIDAAVRVDGFQRRAGHAVDGDGGLYLAAEDLPVGGARLVDAFPAQTPPPLFSAWPGSRSARMLASTLFSTGSMRTVNPIAAGFLGRDFGVSATARTLPSCTIARASHGASAMSVNSHQAASPSQVTVGIAMPLICRPQQCSENQTQRYCSSVGNGGASSRAVCGPRQPGMLAICRSALLRCSRSVAPPERRSSRNSCSANSTSSSTSWA